jgi:Ca-activated chloride channel family protein
MSELLPLLGGGQGLLLGDPWFLALVVPLAVLVVFRLTRRRAAADGAPGPMLGRVPSTWRARTPWLPGLCGLAAAALLVAALARPLQGREESRVTTEGIDIVLVVDASSSMTQQGIEPGVTNLEVVKAVVARFVQGREHDSIGLLSFAAYPRTECPVTLDKEALLERLAAIEPRRAQSEEDGTAIGVAVGHAAAKLKDGDAASKVVVLLTDGENNQWAIDPRDAALLCKDLGIKLYTVGAGRIIDDRGLIKREIPLDTRLLEELAATTGGRFFRAKDTAALVEVYKEIDQLERTERTDVRYTDYEDLYLWLLVPALALLVAEHLLRRGPYLEFAS